jgi:hypothetical protein
MAATIRSQGTQTEDRLAADLVAQARSEWGVPLRLAEDAMGITCGRIDWDHHGPETSARRRSAYFWAVLRRRVLRSHDPELRSLRARFALASVAQDLQDAGLDARAVRARLAAEYPDEVAAADVAFGQLELAG